MFIINLHNVIIYLLYLLIYLSMYLVYDNILFELHCNHVFETLI